MCMASFIIRIVVVVLASFYFFPLNVTFLPGGMNTKKFMAAVGLVVLFVDLVRKRSIKADRSLLFCVLLSGLVSLAGVLSTSVNGTSDMTYATYIVSMAVWLGAAYLVVYMIRLVEGRADVMVLGQYLVSVCLLQCVTALLMDNVPAFKTWMLGWMTGFGFTGVSAGASRMFGMGAFLDVGGTRFAASLVVLAAMIKEIVRKKRTAQIVAYIVSFAFILVVGSMIGRTTWVGAGMALVYWLLTSDFARMRPKVRNLVTRWVAPLLLVLIPVAVVLYNGSPYFHDRVRFAFESFFNLFEKGSFESHSTNILKNMVVWPDNLKTWLIGDGYFQGAANDPNFLGNPMMTDFYMWTDVGYCRFIFYFGLLGLGLFMWFFIQTAVVCSRRQPGFRLMFWMLVLLNFVIWVKVSTDIFVIIAPFMCLDFASTEEEDETDIPPELDV